MVRPRCPAGSPHPAPQPCLRELASTLTARRGQEWEWQLEELALYFLLWSEAANLRHLPECLWFHYWILRNSHMRMAEVGLAHGSCCPPCLSGDSACTDR